MDVELINNYSILTCSNRPSLLERWRRIRKSSLLLKLLCNTSNGPRANRYSHYIENNNFIINNSMKVLPSLLKRFSLEPTVSKSTLELRWPAEQLQCRGVLPSTSALWTSAPALTSSWMARSWPLRAARCNGWKPAENLLNWNMKWVFKMTTYHLDC